MAYLAHARLCFDIDKIVSKKRRDVLDNNNINHVYYGQFYGTDQQIPLHTIWYQAVLITANTRKYKPIYVFRRKIYNILTTLHYIWIFYNIIFIYCLPYAHLDVDSTGN